MKGHSIQMVKEWKLVTRCHNIALSPLTQLAQQTPGSYSQQQTLHPAQHFTQAPLVAQSYARQTTPLAYATMRFDAT